MSGKYEVNGFRFCRHGTPLGRGNDELLDCEVECAACGHDCCEHEHKAGHNCNAQLHSTGPGYCKCPAFVEPTRVEIVESIRIKLSGA